MRSRRRTVARRTKRFLKSRVAIVVLAVAASCVAAVAVLAFRRAYFVARHGASVTVRAKQEGGATFFLIHGWIAASGACVEPMRLTRDGDRLIVRVPLRSA